MNVGTMGARPVPKPSSQTVTEALNLLSAMGGGSKDVRRALEEMKAVQTANEALVEQAKAIIADAGKRSATVAAAEQALAKERDKFEQNSIARRVLLDRLDADRRSDTEKAQAEQDAAAAELAEREKWVTAAEADVAARAIACQAQESAIAGRQGGLAAKEIELGRRQAGLDAAYERLRAAMPS